MSQRDLISESEAAIVTGVSTATLAQFAEAGYLQVETGSQGKRFSRDELSKIFGLSSSTSEARSNEAASLQTRPLSEQVEKIINDGAGAIEEELELLDESPTEDPVISENNRTADSLPDSAGASRESVERDANETAPRHLIQFQDRLLLQRDEELKELRRERDWLRARVEKLEDKGHRDQILLLSEAQTIRKLIQVQEQRRSPLQVALAWLGFESKSNEQQGLIEVRKGEPRTGDEK